jgi:hypothetical protein
VPREAEVEEKKPKRAGTSFQLAAGMLNAGIQRSPKLPG